MKIKVILNNQEKEVELHLKKRHRDKFLKKAQEIEKKGENIESAKEFLDFQDELIIEGSNLTKEEYDNLDLEEQNKLTIATRNIFFPNLEKKN